MSIVARKEVALAQKLDSLDAEFLDWLDVTKDGAELEKHHTQVLALTGHLSGLRDQTRTMLDQAIEDKTVLDDSSNVESLVLGLRRIWEFFRAKLAQRHDPKLRCFLQAADELAWSCYKPMLDLCGTERREPPLVFLNGGLSPYALSRDQAFTAEAVPGEALAGKTYDPILQKLPIPVIGVPWHQVAHLPDLPVVAHETGHAVEHDFGLHDLVVANLTSKLGNGAPRVDAWKAWSREVFADLWGCLTLGPAYVRSLVDFLASSPAVVENQVATPQSKYPTAYLRIMLCADALDRMGFTGEGQTLASEWKGVYTKHAMPEIDQAEIRAVVDAMLGTKLGGGKLDKPLLELGEPLVFATTDWTYAGKGADEQDAGTTPENTLTTIRTWTAATRILYDKSPTRYAEEKHGRALLKYSRTLIDPGTRAGEDEVTEDLKNTIATTAYATGGTWFEEFAAWAMPARSHPVGD